ncbi:MAG: (Fe-S)-binding protein, partial [Desulfofustis sp.]
MDELNRSLAEIEGGCTACGNCVNQCTYLQYFGTPAAQALRFKLGDLEPHVIYSCSLCGLCDVFCPEGLRPSEMFRQMRCRLVEEGRGPLKQHRRILAYEKRGLSKLFSLEMLPRNCRTVFFPGCALAGCGHQLVDRLFQLLNKHIEDLGIVLNCCTKPSYDLGRAAFFEERFSALKNHLRARGVNTVLTACPSCHQIFSRYAAGLEIKTVYEVLADTIDGHPDTIIEEEMRAGMTIHDPCAIRFDQTVQKSVRALATQLGCDVREMKHSRKKTFCCGEGGAASWVAPKITEQWSLKRKSESGAAPV